MKVLVTGGSGFIGTNVIENLRKSGVEILNTDVKPPLCPSHSSYWMQANILDQGSLIRIFGSFRPSNIIHLAARTDCDENVTVEEGYRVNTEGTANVIAAIKSTPSVSRVVITSTQYVHRPGHIPKHDEDYEPHTVYGQSKVLTEKITRQANLNCTWTIVRPTNVWGPWHMRHRKELYRILRMGLYFQPRRSEAITSHAYVRNVSYQILRILELPRDLVHRRIIYVGDRPIKRLEWLNAFSRKVRGRNVYTVPLWAMRSAGLIGDVISLITRKKFLLTTTRVKNMTTDYLVPMEPTFELLGENPFSMEEGIEQTVAWLNAYDRGKYQ